MPDTDIKLRQDELAKVIGMVRRHERTIREQGDQLVRRTLERDRAVLERDRSKLWMETVRAENEELRARLAGYGQVIKAYDNQHAPPSKKTITWEINAQKKDERKKKNSSGRRGPHKRHEGMSASRIADDTVRHAPDKCGSCGSTDLKTVKTVHGMRTNISPPPKATTTCHIV